MNPTIAKMALEWLRAEHRAHLQLEQVPDAVADRDTANFVASQDDIIVAADRVYEVMTGDVRWRDCSPGDRAIWKGMFRDVGRFEQVWRENRAARENAAQAEHQQDRQSDADRERQRLNYPGPQGRAPGPPPYGAGVTEGDSVQPPRGQGERRMRMQGVHQRYWANWYDTIKITADHATEHDLFSGANMNNRIGNYFLTNLQVPGLLASDQTAVITAYYVSLSSMDAIRYAADNVIAQVWLGQKPQHGGPMFVRDLFMGIVPLRPLIVPVRQSVLVTISRRIPLPSDVEPFELAFHMDGLVTRDTP